MLNIKEEIENFLNRKNSIIENYREIEVFCEKEYGENVIVLIEVGSFFEIYCPNGDGKYYDKIKKVSNILNIQLTKRNNKIENIDFKNPHLLGFNNTVIDKYLQILINENIYTIVLIRQKGSGNNAKRYFDKIISPGTNIEYNQKQNEENYICSINLDIINNNYIIGVALTDILGNFIYVHEIYGTQEDNNYALDQLFMLIKSYNIQEFIFNLKNNNIDIDNILKYLEISNISYTIKNINLKIDYQNEILKKFYTIDHMLSPIENFHMERTPLCSEAFILLLEFLFEHDNKILNNLPEPQFLNFGDYVYLGNNPLEQLNIISNEKFNLLKIINNCQTSFGKRMFKERLLNPLTDKIEIQRRYQLIEKLENKSNDLSNQLRLIYDLQRIKRKIDINKLHPYEINNLYDSIIAIVEIYHIHKLNINIENILEIKKDIETYFDLNKTKLFSLNSIDDNFINKNINIKLDHLYQEKEKNDKDFNKIFDQIKIEFQKILNDYSDNVLSYQWNDIDGFYLKITKAKFKIIEKNIEKIFIIDENNNHIFLKDFNFIKRSQDVKITHQEIKKISQNLMSIQSQMKVMINDIYQDILNKLSIKHSETLVSLTNEIGDIDIAITNIYNSKNFKYTKPEIVENTQHNLIEAIDIRHPILERNENIGIFIPNNIILGDKKDIKNQDLIYDKFEDNKNGFLLFGLNSSGKSSIMQSIGLNIIMAQSGMYVAASEFRFTLFNSIFTRIVGKDNPERGLSTFAVEMSELKNILQRMNHKSLILGDEICHGTETISGVSIVASALKEIEKENASFIFATHLHQLVDIPEIKEMKKILMMHLDVYYDDKNDELIYNRKLLEGNGKTIYGLEFAKSLNMKSSFIKTAYNIRKNILEEHDHIDQLMKNNKNKYNHKKLIYQCEICGKNANQTHHIQEQHKADENGLIGHIHKNHLFNLIGVCDNCHDLIHNGQLIISGFQMTSNGLQLDYVEL